MGVNDYTLPGGGCLRIRPCSFEIIALILLIYTDFTPLYPQCLEWSYSWLTPLTEMRVSSDEPERQARPLSLDSTLDYYLSENFYKSTSQKCMLVFFEKKNHSAMTVKDRLIYLVLSTFRFPGTATMILHLSFQSCFPWHFKWHQEIICVSITQCNPAPPNPPPPTFIYAFAKIWIWGPDEISRFSKIKMSLLLN